MPCKQTFALLALFLWGCGPGPCHSASHCKEVDGQAVCDPGYVLRPTTTSKPLRCVEPKADLVINNDAGDSIFTVSYTVGADRTAAVSEVTMSSNSEQRFAGALVAAQDATLDIYFNAFSAGSWHAFTPMTTALQAGDTFVLHYYLDTKSGAYSLGHVWE